MKKQALLLSILCIGLFEVQAQQLPFVHPVKEQMSFTPSPYSVSAAYNSSTNQIEVSVVMTQICPVEYYVTVEVDWYDTYGHQWHDYVNAYVAASRQSGGGAEAVSNFNYITSDEWVDYGPA